MLDNQLFNADYSKKCLPTDAYIKYLVTSAITIADDKLKLVHNGIFIFD